MQYANSQILAQHNGNHTAARYFYLHDRLGSVRQIIDTTGDVANYYTYRPFGRFRIERAETIANPFRFTGQFHDSEINQYYLRARQYDPTISRFTSRDPITGKFKEPLTLHRYLYCINDPINKIDPFGRDYIDINFTWSYGILRGAGHGILWGSGTANPWGVAAGFAGGVALGGLGGTAGLMTDLDTSKAYFYAGPSWTSRPMGGVDITTSYSPDDVTTGWKFAIAGAKWSGYWQHGWDLGQGTTFDEYGITSSGSRLGISLSAFYVFPEMDFAGPGFSDPIRYFRDEVDLLTKAVWMGQMLQDTGQIIGGGDAGIAFYLNAVFTARMLGM